MVFPLDRAMANIPGRDGHAVCDLGQMLQGFANMGLGIALDDFGTGYSSLTHLRKFPVTSIKIDRSFVANLAESQDDAAIVSAIVGMGRSLRLSTLAEGIETSEQLAFLRQLNCDAMQGYYFSEPLAPQAFATLLAAGLPPGMVN